MALVMYIDNVVGVAETLVCSPFRHIMRAI